MVMKAKKMTRSMLLFCGFIQKQRVVHAGLEFHASEQPVSDTVIGQINQHDTLCNGYGSIHIGDAKDCYPNLGLTLSRNLAILSASYRYQKQ
jgi:hypothetical protein